MLLIETKMNPNSNSTIRAIPILIAFISIRMLLLFTFIEINRFSNLVWFDVHHAFTRTNEGDSVYGSNVLKPNIEYSNNILIEDDSIVLLTISAYY